MKNSEDTISGWIDDSVDDRTRAEIESRFTKEMLEQEKAAASRIGELLRTHTKVPVLESPDFFTSQILEQISRDSESTRESPERAAPAAWRWWSPRLAWAAVCVALAGMVLMMFIPADDAGPQPLVVNIEESIPGFHVSSFTGETDRYAVVWVDGWDYIPGDTRIR